MTDRIWRKRGRLFCAQNVAGWWVSHTMAPAAIELDQQRIRIYLGCWDAAGISRIGFIDVDSADPSRLLAISQRPVLDIGRDGMFDENGVFPGHVVRLDGKIHLYYTGFMLGHKIRHFNFGGLAVSSDGTHFTRVSEAPVLDRADEGLHVRAGQSVLCDGGQLHCVYSAGSGWVDAGGIKRPTYDVYYQRLATPVATSRRGVRLVQCDQRVEHGLGRPQLCKLGDDYYLFYTRRLLDMRYHMGCARSTDLVSWSRVDSWVGLPHGAPGEFDHEMVYFPCVVETAAGRRYLFYSGNRFGGGGLGWAELTIAACQR